MRRPSVIHQWLGLACALSIMVAAAMVYERRLDADAGASAGSLDDYGAVDVPASPEVPATVEVPVTVDVPASPVASKTDSADIGAVAPPPFPDQFEPSPNEVQADAKRLGAAVAYQITNYGWNSSVIELVERVTVDPARVDALAREAEIVHHPGMWSRGTIEYAQLGGHRDDRISIMVVVRQELGRQATSDAERAETRTMDVRLAKGASGAWVFEELASAGGIPIARPGNLSPLAASVVDDPRIDLPDTATWDIYSGQTGPALHEVMLDIAERTPYSVIVLKTGHPHNVFGTERLSNHTVGRAVDIHEVGSDLVIDSHDTTSSIYALSEWLVSRPDIKEFGSPWRFDDAVAHNFTDEVHHDHLHVGVYAEDHVAG